MTDKDKECSTIINLDTGKTAILNHNFFWHTVEFVKCKKCGLSIMGKNEDIKKFIKHCDCVNEK